ncbi:MAG: hypothetical protein R3F33_01305 [Planctomycetota bacterium]
MEVELAPAEVGRRFKAEGHQTLHIPPGAGELLMQPDAQLVLKAEVQGTKINPNRVVIELVGPGAKTLRLCTSTDDGELRYAVSRPLGERSTEGYVDIHAALRNGRVLAVTWKPNEGQADVAQVPERWLAPAKSDTLWAKVDRVKVDERRKKQWIWHLTPAGDVPGQRMEEKLQFPWGTLAIQSAFMEAQRETSCSYTRLHSFEDVVFGRRYVLTARTSSMKNFGRSIFEFQGQRIEVPTHRNFTIRLQLLRSPDGAPVFASNSRIDVRFGDESDTSALQWSSHFYTESSEQGECRFPAYNDLPDSDSAAWPPPRSGTIRIHTPGFAETYIPFAWNGLDAQLDLGVVRLEEVANELVVYLLHAPDQPFEEVFIGGDDADSLQMLSWPLPSEGQSPRAALALVEDEDRASLRHRLQQAQSSGLGMALKSPNGPLRYLEWSAGQWAEVPSERFHFTVIVSEQSLAYGPVRFGFTWKGVTVHMGRVIGTQEIFYGVDTPVEGIQWWSETHTDGGDAIRKFMKPNRENGFLID